MSNYLRQDPKSYIASRLQSDLGSFRLTPESAWQHFYEVLQRQTGRRPRVGNRAASGRIA